MRLTQAFRAVPARLRRPGVWGVSLAWMLLSLATWAYNDLSSGGGQRLGFHLGFLQFMNNVMDPVIHLLLSPFAWQWSGSDRTMAPFWRAIPQSIAVTFLAHVVLKSPWGFLAPRMDQTVVPFDAAATILGTGGVILLSLFSGFFIAWGEHLDQLKTESLAKALEAKWTLLRSQMSPHLVLNALNGMAGLVEEDPPRAAQGLEDLAELYQQLLELGEVEEVSLGRERALLERYLAVEQLRLDKNLRIQWEWGAGLDRLPLLPLLLQPLVENAIKHGISPCRTGGELRISSRRLGTCLCLVVRNTGCGLRVDVPPGTGIGLRNLRQRLELAFGSSATFDLRQNGEWTLATLMLPIPSRMEESPGAGS